MNKLLVFLALLFKLLKPPPPCPNSDLILFPTPLKAVYRALLLVFCKSELNLFNDEVFILVFCKAELNLFSDSALTLVFAKTELNLFSDAVLALVFAKALLNLFNDAPFTLVSTDDLNFSMPDLLRFRLLLMVFS